MPTADLNLQPPLTKRMLCSLSYGAIWWTARRDQTVRQSYKDPWLRPSKLDGGPSSNQRAAMLVSTGETREDAS